MIRRPLEALAGLLPPPARRVVMQLAGRDLEMLVTALLIVFPIWGFALLADAVVEGETRRMDERLLLALRNADNPADAIGPHWLESSVRDITALGSVTVLTLVCIAVIVFLLIRRQFHAAVLVGVSSLGGALLMSALKGAFGRARPTIVPHLVDVGSLSFPSGHALAAATVYLTLGALLARLVRGRRQKAYMLGVAMVLVFLVGASRVYLGVHYPSDVLGGWAVGLAWSTACWSITSWLQRRGTVEKPTETTAQADARADAQADAQAGA